MEDMILLALKRSLTADDALANYNQGPGKLSELLRGRDLSLEGFKRLMCSDTSFGGFGIPVPQYDAFLRVMAATSFQPYDASILANEHDVLFLLTPIVRLLTTEWAVLMKMTDFEGSSLIPIQSLLPYKPRSGFEQRQYTSLLEVVHSVWFILCHAYVELQTSKRVRSLACYGQDGKRAKHVWIDIDMQRVGAFVGLQARKQDARANFTAVMEGAVYGDNGSQGSLIRIVSAYPRFEKRVVVVDELLVISTGADGSTNNTRFLGHSECVPADAIHLETIENEPYMCVVRGMGTGFLLITTDGHIYSEFYRLAPWSPNGLTEYPICLHPYEPVYDQDDCEVFLISGICARCGKMTIHGTRCNNRIYCGSKCINEGLAHLDSASEKEMESSLGDSVDTLVELSTARYRPKK